MHGKTIELFLVNGRADSLITAELSNWNGKAIKIPRTEIECYNRDDIKSAGVYFLFCQTDDENDSVYIGEAENILDRLKQHMLDYKNDKEAYYWNTAVLFIGNELTKAHIRYLEDRFVKEARNCGRYNVLTKNTYSKTFLKESQRECMEEFIDNVKIIINALGYKVLEMAPKAQNNTSYLYIKNDSVDAKGYLSSGGFTVCKGSKISAKVVDSMEKYVKSYYELRNKLILNEVIKNGEFTIDYEFSAPSAAADVILGCSTNGLTAWKNKDGEILKKL